MAKTKIAAIIPAYNEAKTIADVVRAAKGSDLLDEIIVVSDGSRDKTAEIAKKAGAKVFELKPNRGKGGAMAYGVKQTKSDIILFLDADLRGLTAGHIKRLLEPVIRGKMAMAVGIRDRGKIISKIAPYLPLIGGERAMQKFIFERVPEKFLKGFMVEEALNFYCRSRRLPYGTVFLPGLSMRKKMQKVGFWHGLWQYIKMSKEVTKAMIAVRLAHRKKKF
jgi:glycosyltransferase involved in cell wall biosynthesis